MSPVYQWFVVAVMAASILLPGCVKLGPDFDRPELGTKIPEKYQHSPLSVPESFSQDRWWEEFDDPELNGLVKDALENNLDIKKATATVLELAYLSLQSRADRFPSVDLEAGAERTRKSVEVSRLVFQGMSPTVKTRMERRNIDSHRLSVPAAFEIDLWGRLARAHEAARAELLVAEENRRTIAQSVVAGVVDLYFRMEAAERRIQIANRKIKNNNRSLEFVRGRYRRGLVSILDVRQARRALAEAKASLPSLRRELGEIQQNLSVLLGRYPKTRPSRKHKQDYFKDLSPVPPGLPSDLLLRRPDVRSAEAKLKALNARVGVAKANRFPRITLTGNFGYSSESLHRLLDPESELWRIAAGLAQPLFDAGRLKAAHEAARVRYREGIVDYSKTVLEAFSEVEKALLNREEQIKRRERVLELLEEAKATQRIAEDRYSRGLVDYLSVLDAQQSRFEVEDRLVLVELAILTNRTTLYRALGGGWAEPPQIDWEEVGGLESFVRVEWNMEEKGGSQDQ